MARKDLPSPNASNFLPRVHEEIHALLGKLGNAADRALTVREAIDTGVLVPGPGGSLVPGAGSGGTGGTYERDLTPPPQPGLFTATGAISHFLISQAQPLYSQGHGHNRTVVYGAQWTSGPLPVFANAVELDRFAGTVRAVASNPATTWRLWIKWESNDGVLSATPAGGTNGVEVTTGQDVALLLEALSGQISSSELATSLATPISQIPSISAAASDALTKANQSLASIATMQTELANLSGTPDYDAGTTYALDDLVKYSGGLYRALGPTTGNLPTNAAYWQKVGDYASLGDAVAAHAAQLADHQTRITNAEGALTARASDITQLQTDLATTNNTVATKANSSTVAALDSRVSSVEGVNTAQGSAITNLQTGLETVNNGLSQKADASALSALSGIVTQQGNDLEAVSNQTTLLRSSMNARSLGIPLEQWSLNGQQVVTLSDGVVGAIALRLIHNPNSYPNQGFLTPIDRSKTYRISFWARPSSNCTGLLYFNLRQFLIDGVSAGPYNGGRAPYKPSGWTKAEHDSAFGSQWGLYSFIWGAADWQPGAAYVLPEFLDNYYTSPSTTGHWEIQDFRFEDVTRIEALGSSKADASALASLSATVTQHGTDISTVSGSVTALQNSLETTNNAVATKASTSYVDSVETRVDAVEGTVSSHGTQISGLSSGLETVANGLATKANASALTETNTNVSNLAGTVSSQAGQITTLQSSVNSRTLGLPLDQWLGLGAQQIVTLSDGRIGNKALRLTGGGGEANQGTYVPIDRTKTYRVSFYARPSVENASGLLYFNLRQAVSISPVTWGPENVGRSPYKPSAQTPSAHNATHGDQQWGLYSYTWGPADWQEGVTHVQPEFLQNYPSAAGYWEIQDFRFEDVTAIENLTASLQAEASTRATQTGELYAQYTVKLDVGGKVSGFGLASTGPTGEGSSFAIRADRFYIAPPATGAGDATADIMPFVVQATATTINGVAVPAGVYMNDAYIKNGTITNAKIANLAVDAAKIADAAIGTAKIADAAITSAKIGAAQVATANIQAAAITSAKVADAAITSAKIEDAAITSAKIGNAAITSAKIGEAQIVTLNIADNAASASASASGSSDSISTSVNVKAGVKARITAIATYSSGAPSFTESDIDIDAWLNIDGNNFYTAAPLRSFRAAGIPAYRRNDCVAIGYKEITPASDMSIIVSSNAKSYVNGSNPNTVEKSITVLVSFK